MQVLIADKDDSFLKILQSYLSDHGHEAEIADDGLACITLLREFEPNVLVMEHELLWGGSVGVMAVMRADPLTSQIPVILVTDTRQQFESLEWLGFAGWLQKPFQLATLLGQIVLASHPMADANLRLGAHRSER